MSHVFVRRIERKWVERFAAAALFVMLAGRAPSDLRCAADQPPQPPAAGSAPADTTDSVSTQATERRRGRREPQEVEGVDHFRRESALLTAFWGRPMEIEAGVVLPPGHDPAAKNTPVCYSIHGFGGSHREAWRAGPDLRRKMAEGDYPRMIYVYLNAQFPMGHHEFADSVNNGPWGKALTEEFIPALESTYGAAGISEGRFVTGHSSGGWSSLWLQVNYPTFFNGTWSTAPDAVDFRDFTGINVYEFKNAFVDPQGNPIQLVRGNDGDWVQTVKDYVEGEFARSDYGGQFASFDAVFSPRGEDGRPMPLFDRKTGEIHADAARAWERYDIRLILKNGWPTLQPRLAGKLHIFVGSKDTYRLEGAVLLLQQELASLGSDAEFRIAEDRHHGNLGMPHETWWPAGLRTHIHSAMWARWKAAAPASK